MASKLALIALVVVSVAVVAYADEQPRYNAQASYGQPSYEKPSYGAPSYHAPKYDDKRVKIQVYRGPNKDTKAYGGQGYGYEESFAPHGYYVTQPEDDKPYYKAY